MQRPGLDGLVERDLGILMRAARRAQDGTELAHRVGVVGLATGFADNLRQELDFRREAQNLAAMHEEFHGPGPVRVPRPHLELSTRRVLTEERLDGRPLRLIDDSPDNPLERANLALLLRFDLTIDPQLAGLFRALATLEGTLRLLDADFDLIEQARSSITDPEQKVPGTVRVLRNLGAETLELLPALRRLPRRLDQLSHLAERGELTVRIRLFADQRDVRHVERLTDRMILASVSASVGLVSALLLALPAKAVILDGTNVDQILGYAGLAAATLLGLRVVAAVGRHRK